MKEPKITYAQFMKETDKYRKNITNREIKLTKEQRKFILKCRDHEEPVAFIKMAILWEQFGWGKVSRTAIQVRWNKIQKGEL